LTESNVKIAFIRAALTAGISVPITFGETRNAQGTAINSCCRIERAFKRKNIARNDI